MEKYYIRIEKKKKYKYEFLCVSLDDVKLVEVIIKERNWFNIMVIIVFFMKNFFIFFIVVIFFL